MFYSLSRVGYFPVSLLQYENVQDKVTHYLTVTELGLCFHYCKSCSMYVSHESKPIQQLLSCVQILDYCLSEYRKSRLLSAVFY